MFQGPFEVPFDVLFPHGGLLHGGVNPMRDFEKSSGDRFVQALDKHSGLPVWTVDFIDSDPEAREKSHRVKVAAKVQPVPPEALPGLPLRPVELEGLSFTPYVNDRGRVTYSFRATGLRAPTAKTTSPSASSLSSASGSSKQAA